MLEITAEIETTARHILEMTVHFIFLFEDEMHGIAVELLAIARSPFRTDRRILCRRVMTVKTVLAKTLGNHKEAAIVPWPAHFSSNYIFHGQIGFELLGKKLLLYA